MRPLRSLPLTWARSTPSSRATRRTAGLAYGTLSGITAAASNGTGGVRGPAPSKAAASDLAGAGAGAADSFGAGAGAGVGAAAAAGAGFAAPASAASISATTVPSAISSPTFTFTSLTTPSNGAGTSIVALSDSSVTRPWSRLTVSPRFTSTSITGTFV